LPALIALAETSSGIIAVESKFLDMNPKFHTCNNPTESRAQYEPQLNFIVVAISRSVRISPKWECRLLQYYGFQVFNQALKGGDWQHVGFISVFKAAISRTINYRDSSGRAAACFT
jgi:hypothetical protein